MYGGTGVCGVVVRDGGRDITVGDEWRRDGCGVAVARRATIRGWDITVVGDG